MAGARPPDVVGYPLEDARQALVDAGWTVGEVIEARPPRRTLLDPQRVVRQRAKADGSVELVICGERSDGERA